MGKIRIRMLKDVRPDLFFLSTPGTILHKGMEYEAVANSLGVVSGVCENGEQLGVKPDEFEFLLAPVDLLVLHGKVEKGSFFT